MIHLSPLGDRAFLARFASERDARNWARTVRSRRWPGVLDVVLAYASAAVFADPERVELSDLERWLKGLGYASKPESSGPLVPLPVLYDGDDLDEVAQRLGLTREAVVEHHASREYTVFAIGFLPGFPYCGYLPPELSGLSRRESPRTKVPPGSVAIAGRQTGVYPKESPGGWHLIGRTPLRIVDLDQAYFPIRSGDRIRFVPIGEEEYRERTGELLETPQRGTMVQNDP